MAQAIKAENVTPADELRGLLALAEKRVSNLRGSGAGALDLLQDMDRIGELWPELEAQGVDLRPELGRWETLHAVLQRRGAELVREMQAAGGLPAARAQHHPGGQAAWWWFLDEQVRRQRRRRLVRTGAILVGTAVVAGLLYFLVFHVFFPVDPNLVAALAAQNAAEQKIGLAGDYAGALLDFRRAAELQPEDAGAWLRVGCTLLKLGDAAAAEENFGRARVLLADDLALRLARAPICLSVGLPDQAEADLQAVIAADPQSALAYYHLATVYEERGALQEAIAALERAADLADAGGEERLVPMARYRAGLLMQQMAGQSLTAQTPTP